MVKYIWQKDSWTNFIWESEKIMNPLLKVKRAQGYLLGRTDFIELKEQGDILTEEAFTTSAIEGETLDRNAIRSSVAKRLGLPIAGLPKIKRNSDGLVELLIDATLNHNKSLSKADSPSSKAGLAFTLIIAVSK